jgi:hypothetical protein
MLRLLGLLVRLVIRLKVIVVSMGVGAAIAYGLSARQASRTWGLDAADVGRELPGDGLVDEPDHVETRSLVIDALPASIWPLLMRLGYGRGGWYSYPVLDRAWRPIGPPSRRAGATAGTPDGDLAEGDIVPTDPDGGLVARVVEAERALVLYLDDATLRERLERQAAEGSDQARQVLDDLDEMPSFGLSWAFVLEPEPGGRTRLVERVRLRMEVGGAQRRALPFMGLGLFAVMRRQMIGIKQRVENAAG